jgi:hypothetical protein
MPFQLLTPTEKTLLGFGLLFLLVTPLFPFLYMVRRWRAGGQHEPGHGTHAAFLYFVHGSLLLLGAGSANLIYGAWSSTPVEPFQKRLSWGMFCGSIAFIALNTVLAWRMRVPAAWNDARRVFRGFLLVMAGFVTATMLVLLFVTWFEKTETDRAAEQRLDDLKLYASWAMVFLATYLAAAFLLMRKPFGDRAP